MIGKDTLYEFKQYVGDFSYDLIIVSNNRIAIINQGTNQYIELNNSFMMIDILEYLISSKDSLTDIFECCTVRYSTDDYLKHYLSNFNYEQVA